MDATVEPWLDLWDYLDRNFWGFWQWAAAHLTPEQACWQPTQRVASIGWNLQHLGEMLDHYLSRVFDQGDRVPSTPLLTMVPGNLDTGRYRDLQAISLYHQKVRPAYRALL